MTDAKPFTPPDFTSDLDVEAWVGRCPSEATTRGMFLTSCADMGRRAAPSRVDEVYAGLTARRWTPFLDYPLRDMMRLMVNVTRLRWPHEPLREGLRRVGWTSYSTFQDSMAGRIIFAVGPKDMESKMGLVAKGVSLSVSHAILTPRRMADRHWRLDYDHVYCFLDSHHVGIVEGYVRAHGFAAQIGIRAESPDRATFDLRW